MRAAHSGSEESGTGPGATYMTFGCERRRLSAYRLFPLRAPPRTRVVLISAPWGDVLLGQQVDRAVGYTVPSRLRLPGRQCHKALAKETQVIVSDPDQRRQG